MEHIIDYVVTWVPAIVTFTVCAVTILLVRRFVFPIRADHKYKLWRRVFTIVAMLTTAAALIISLPISTEKQAELLSFFGILVTATIALSSTTFIGNVMAGLMLKTVRGFKIGDFIQVDNHFGRVTDSGMLRTEIQTEFRDLTALSNLYLITNPITTIQKSGTIIWAEVSLGYDVSWKRVEEHLLKAAKLAGLKSPFVRVLELGDFSIVYRCNGLLEDVSKLLSVRSELRKQMLDELHRNGIEIVSPAFMNQRPIPTQVFIPKPDRKKLKPVAEETAPENVIFDKAEKAQEIAEIQEEISTIDQEITTAPQDADKPQEVVKEDLAKKKEQLEERLTDLKEDAKGES